MRSESLHEKRTPALILGLAAPHWPRGAVILPGLVQYQATWVSAP
jgi:hypothetical protein